MTPFDPQTFQRRKFLRAVGGLIAGAFSASLTRANDLPTNTSPRAIFGDSVEPDWDQRLTLKVGPQKADLVGATDRVIQAAETRGPGSRIGILIGAETRNIRSEDNRIEGFATSISDLRKK
jgi:hypothetical protein